jgi:hypothetical protein
MKQIKKKFKKHVLVEQTSMQPAKNSFGIKTKV